MAPQSTPSDGKNPDADGTTTAVEFGLIPEEGQLLQSITSLQSQLDAVSQRQNELIQLIGVLREPQRGPVPPTSSCGCPHMPEQPHTMPVNHPSVPGRPATQQIPPSQGQVRGPGQQTFHHFDPNGRPLMPPPFPHPVPVYNQLHDRNGYVIGLVRQGSPSLSERTGANPGVRHVLPGWTQQSQMHRPPVYPQMQPQVNPQMPPQTIPQVPPQLHTQILPQNPMQGPIPTNWGAPPAPPPPYPGPTPGTGQCDPLTRCERADNAPTRANPPRRARPKDLSKLE